MTDIIRAYYRTKPSDLSSITDLSFRHFRFFLSNGRFLKVNDRITSPATLQRWCVRYRPLDVYYSTSCWLAPEHLGRRERTPLSRNVFLFSDIVFDIDRSPFSKKNLDLARQDTISLIRFLDEQSIRIKYIAFSGSKGFHVICADPNRYLGTDPLEREDMAKAYRNVLMGRVCNVGICCDTKITPDTRRIIRVPGTINSKSGYVCTTISREALDRPVGEMLKSVQKIDLSAPRIPLPGDETPLRGSRIISWLLHRFGVRWKPHLFFTTSLVNSVPGIPLQVPFFTYPSGIQIRRIREELVQLQNTYGLSDIYLFSSGTTVQAVSLRTYPLRRLEKVIGASSSTNYGALLKYKQLFFRIGTAYDEKGREVYPAPHYIGTIEANEEQNGHFVSFPHYTFFQEWGIPLREYIKMHGNGPVSVTHAVVEL